MKHPIAPSRFSLSAGLRTAAIAVLGIAAVGACRSTDALSPLDAGIARIRQLSDPYHELTVATSAGYSVWSPDPAAAGATCPSSAEGKMGYHRVNVALRGGAADPAAGDAVIDVDKPEMLLYEKSAAGAMQLVGVEYIVFKAAWERANGAGAPAPVILGQPLLLSSHVFPGNASPIDHYELHLWVWKDNPLGMFYPYHPNITC
ncbi:MAG TPA: hypothetical protein VM033_00255 [Gemmatimonadaceae bacterium]|nr:hypothetical protein [Gemmatimonadaceae bacterium]